MTARINAGTMSTVQLVPLTPMSEGGRRVEYERLTMFARDLYEAGIRVFLPAAGTGEFHSLSTREVVQCVEATKAGVGPDAIVIAPVGFGLAHALEIGRGAIENEADGLLVMPPVHPYLCDEGVREYLLTLAKELPLPLLAYKKGPAPSDALLLELCKAGKLAGVKYGENILDAAAKLVKAVGDAAVVSCGIAERYAAYFHLAGAIGYTSGAGNLCPRLTLAMHAALVRSDYAEATRLLNILRPIEEYRARAGDSYNISMLKAAMQATGRDFGPARLPQRPITASEQREIEALVEPILAQEQKLAK
ncbi:MAG: dihydrodipicolinate synthase family protein [Pirellulaceae bacterium]|nr:dihydrodipicolinate synthase family protein [Pirellulaceae bacterium]